MIAVILKPEIPHEDLVVLARMSSSFLYQVVCREYEDEVEDVGNWR